MAQAARSDGALLKASRLRFHCLTVPAAVSRIRLCFAQLIPLLALKPEEFAMSLVKIIVITIIVLLSILFFGRFFV